MPLKSNHSSNVLFHWLFALARTLHEFPPLSTPSAAFRQSLGLLSACRTRHHHWHVKVRPARCARFDFPQAITCATLLFGLAGEESRIPQAGRHKMPVTSAIDDTPAVRAIPPLWKTVFIARQSGASLAPRVISRFEWSPAFARFASQRFHSSGSFVNDESHRHPRIPIMSCTQWIPIHHPASRETPPQPLDHGNPQLPPHASTQGQRTGGEWTSIDISPFSPARREGPFPNENSRLPDPVG